ncbi:GntR family transcriptional regulator [Candidatus Frankia nodulisporulans]|uniref:GntR family transcriptional regulator n=1 Tax=Candidatus Frankia nodulisporulans TaxID=2060052 RepID=UPI0013D7A07A|nr:GntR family transcriptional regulator [Candidatus Frankia nodulisporulans]
MAGEARRPTKVNPSDPTPAYLQIANDLRSAIEANELPHGALLPSLRTMERDYGAAGGTVRRALDQLVAEGLIYARQGQGIFVRRPRRILRDGSRRHLQSVRPSGTGPMEAEASTQGFVRAQTGIVVTTESAAGEVADRLGVEHGTPTLRRDMILTLDDEPAGLVSSWFPTVLVAGSVIARPERVPGGVHAELVRIIGALGDATEELVARMPTPGESTALRLPGGTPVVELWRTIPAQDGTPVEITRFIYDGSRYRFAYTVPVD